jgi:pimeloyl-ACP methyl ester carboxylesterase
MKEFFIDYQLSTMSFSAAGEGEQLVICFHGYGELGSHFGFLAAKAGGDFTFLAMDLPFHGKTAWREARDLDAHDLELIIEQTLQSSELRRFAGSRAILLGFSMGGRVALSLYQLSPHRYKKMVLLASDGLKVNFWYWLATQTALGNSLFAFTLRHPGWFLWLLKIGNRLVLVNASIFKFVLYYIGDKTARDLLYSRWTVLRNLKPDIKTIRDASKRYGTLIRLIYGKYDRIIIPKRGQRLRKGIENVCSIKVIESGHQLLHRKNEVEIIDALRH